VLAVLVRETSGQRQPISELGVVDLETRGWHPPMSRRCAIVAALSVLSVSAAACASSSKPTASAPARKSAATSTTTTTAPATAPLATTSQPPPTTPAIQLPSQFPPQNYVEAQELALAGNKADLSLFDTKNEMGSCPSSQYDVTVIPGLSNEQLAADLLAWTGYQATGLGNCGGLSVDAYNNQSDASPGGATAGEATAGNVQLLISHGQDDVFVTIGSAVSPTVQFKFIANGGL